MSAERALHVWGVRCVLAWLLVGHGLPARADQPADWMFKVEEPGHRITLDYLGTGAQLSYNHSRELFGFANNLDVGVGVLAGYPLGQAVAGADLRVLFFTLGGSVGYRTVWRSLRFEPGEDGRYCRACSRMERIDQDPIFGGGPTMDGFVLGEVHATILAPLNDHVMFTTSVSPQYEGRAPRSFDWWYGTLHDGGVIWNWPTRLYFHHPDWGGIGPYVHQFRYPQNGELQTRWAFGFDAVRRLGLMDRDDLIYLTFLMRPGDRYFGHHTYYGPFRALFIYRTVLHLE